MHNDSTSTSTVVYVVVVVVAVLVASVLAPVVWSATQGSDGADRSTVSVITLRGGTGSANVASVADDLREARNNDSVEAVVLRMDSGGGPVGSSEELYMEVNRTAQEMPVVAYVEGTAASGGYYGIAPADAIYVKPSSVVGSVGVIATVPEIIERQNDIGQVVIRSGPDKATLTVDEVRTTVEEFQNTFVGTVMKHRGDELTVSETEVARAGVYTGTHAVENGFADEIGSLDSAIERAANESEEIEGDNYDVEYKEPVVPSFGLFLFEEDVDRQDGKILVVERTGETDDEFVQPVKYYAVWGVLEDRTVNGQQEVTTNATG
jgi:protease-4